MADFRVTTIEKLIKKGVKNLFSRIDLLFTERHTIDYYIINRPKPCYFFIGLR